MINAQGVEVFSRRISGDLCFIVLKSPVIIDELIVGFNNSVPYIYQCRC